MPIENIGAILSSTQQIGGNAAETAVAKAFLTRHVNHYDRVQIEVPLGPGLGLGPNAPQYLQKCATAAWSLRADMILWRGNVATIVEAKERLDGRAIGQLLTYYKLLRQDNPSLLQVYKIAAGVSILNGITSIFFDYGITVELFPYAVAQTGS
jgi:hypothetical protein